MKYGQYSTTEIAITAGQSDWEHVVPKPSIVLVDGENWFYLATRFGHSRTLDDLFAALRKHFPESRIVIFSSRVLTVKIRSMTQWPSSHLEDAANAIGAEIFHTPEGVHLDHALAQYAVTQIPNASQLVLASADRGFLPVIHQARAAGVVSVLLAKLEDVPVELALAADAVIDPRTFLRPVEGLIAPGDASTLASFLTQAFTAARTGIIILDPYVGPPTVRLLTVAPANVEITVIGQLVQGARSELQLLHRAGRPITVIQNSRIHDRWFCIDNHWWHSGGSLKDLGNKFSRLSAITPSEIAAHEKMLQSLLASGTTVQL